MKQADRLLSWASSTTPHSIVTLVLIGQWKGDHEVDKALVAQLAGQSYETVESEVTNLVAVADSLFTKGRKPMALRLT